MPKKDYLPEIENIRNWCEVVLTYLKHKYYSQDHRNSSTMDEMINHLSNPDKPIKNTNAQLKGYETAKRDVLEMIKDMPTDYKTELDGLLIKTCGIGLVDAIKEKNKMLAKVIKRGHLINEDEYRLIDEQVDELCQTNGDEGEIKRLNNLLSTFNPKTRKAT